MDLNSNLEKIYRHYIETDEELDLIRNNDMKFQALSWHDGDFVNEDDIDEDNVEDEPKLEYKIIVHGVNEKGESVCLRINRFTPYFYINLPEKDANENELHWNEMSVEKFIKKIKKKMGRLSYSLVSAENVEKVKLYPYLANTKFKFVRLVFSNMKGFRRCSKYIFNEAILVDDMSDYPIFFEQFESNVPPLNRFSHIQDVLTAGWIKIKKDKFKLLENNFGDYEPELISRSQIVIESFWKDVKPYDKHDIAPLKIFSWDIECKPFQDGEFPNPRVEGDVIAQIGIVVWKYGDYDESGKVSTTKIIITDSPCSPIDGVIVLACKNECELLKTFCNLIESIDPDIITGYNTWGFDDQYFWIRAMGCNCPRDEKTKKYIDELCQNGKCWKGYGLDSYTDKLSRLTEVQSELKKRNLSSGAYGDNTFYTLETHGRETLDLLISVRRDHKLDSYKLDNVAFYFTKQKKEDLPYKELFRRLKGGPDDIAICAKYCVQDSNLVVQLINKLVIIPNSIEMAKATYVPMGWLLFRGQQCKVFSLVVKEAREKGYVVPIGIPSDNRKFVGATVLNPLRGAYYAAVAGLDFASLYPSIMIAYNLCYSTIVLDDKYKNLEGVNYETIEWEVEDERFSLTFVQAPNEYNDKWYKKSGQKGTKGLLPEILDRLWQGRKETKRLMKTEQDPFKKQVLNGKQLAQKVTMNSVYGFTGTGEKGMLPCKAIAVSVTAKGRQMIDQTKQLAEENYPGAIALYGDSIPEYEKVVVKRYNPDPTKEMTIMEKRVDQLGELFNQHSLNEDYWRDYPLFKSMPKNRDEFLTPRFNKQYFTPEEVWMTRTHKGWAPIKRVIRHNVVGKKLIKVVAREKKLNKNGQYIYGPAHEVIVTEGHSLINNEGKLIEAGELEVGTKLMN